MNKRLFFAFAVILCSLSAQSQTNVSGNITQNTTWTKAGSPYTLAGNVGVPSAYTLTIEPGVVVQRDADYQILINGALQCNGTTTDSIVFASGASLTAGAKFFIDFKKSNVSNSGFSYTSFQNSSGLSNNLFMGNPPGGLATIPQNSGTLHFSHSNLSNGYMVTNDYYTDAPPAVLQIDSCYIGAGYIHQLGTNAEPVIISGTQVYNTGFTDNFYGVHFTNCSLNGASLPQTGRYSFLNCTLEDSRLGGTADNAGFGQAYFTGSTLINTSLSATQTSFYITNCTVTYTADKVYNLDGTESHYLITTDGLSLSGSQLTNNSINRLNGINLTGTGYNNFTTVDTIVHNQFSNLYDAVTVNYFPSIILDSNNFFTVGRFDIINYTSKDFSALYNFYQLFPGETIDDVIFDQNDDLSYGLVTYTPYSPGLILPVSLTSFTGRTEGNTVVVRWITGNEENVSGFIVQKKQGSGYIDMGTVASSNMGKGAAYSFTDASPAAGNNYYRLKIVDRDGKYAYSTMIPVDYDDRITAWRIYPNPASSYIVVEYSAAANGTQLQLTNAGGSLIKTITVAAGSTQARIPVHGVAKGVYKLVMKDGTRTDSKTVVIQ